MALQNGISSNAEATAVSAVMDNAQDCLDTLLATAAPIANSELPSSIIQPAEAAAILSLVDTAARSRGLVPAIAGPLDLHSLPASAAALSDGNWEVVLHMPLINPREAFVANIFPNLPFLFQGRGVMTATEPGLVATTAGLLEDREAFYLPTNEIKDHCFTLPEVFVCEAVQVFRDILSLCPASLLGGRTDACDLCQAPQTTTPWREGDTTPVRVRANDVECRMRRQHVNSAISWAAPPKGRGRLQAFHSDLVFSGPRFAGPIDRHRGTELPAQDSGNRSTSNSSPNDARGD